MDNRPYQDAALEAVRTEYQRGVRQQLLSMATGTGKTVVFSQLPNKMSDILPGQMMVLAHREELIDQAIDKMRRINPHLRIDKEMATHHADPSIADCIVASVATLGRKNTPRINKFNWERIDKFVTDEAHHSTATTYQNIYNASGVLHPSSNQLLLGVTATPNRADGKALAQIYKKIVFTYGMRSAIEDGWLVDVRGVRVNTQTSLDEVKTIAGDFAQDMLSDTVNNPQRNQLVVKAWLDNAENRQTVGFTVDIQHAKDLAEMFRKYGVKAEAIWGDDPQRAEKLIAHKNKEITVLLNCGVLTEGYDDWRIACILLARPTKSSSLYVQMVGRGTRLQDGCGNLKEPFGIMLPRMLFKQDCIVIDVVDNSSKHSLVTLPTLMGMSGSIDLRGKSMVAAIRAIENAQREFSHIDFSNLRDIDNLKAYIQQVDLFNVKYPDEVVEYSEFKWRGAIDGGFIISLPNKAGEVTIKQNLLDKWEISAIINNQKYKGIRDTVDESFVAAENLISDKIPHELTLLKRKGEKWHEHKPTQKQLDLLAKLFKGKPLPNNLTKGQASELIDSVLNKRK